MEKYKIIHWYGDPNVTVTEETKETKNSEEDSDEEQNNCSISEISESKDFIAGLVSVAYLYGKSKWYTFIDIKKNKERINSDDYFLNFLTENKCDSYINLINPDNNTELNFKLTDDFLRGIKYAYEEIFFESGIYRTESENTVEGIKYLRINGKEIDLTDSTIKYESS